MARIWIVLSSLAALVATTLAAAPSTGADLQGMGGLTGKVTGPKSLVLGRVFALNKEKNVRYSVYTVNGAYRITNMFPGRYEISVQKAGFAGKPVILDVKSGTQAEGNIAVQEAKIEPDYVGGLPYPESTKIEPYDKIYPAGPGRDIAERTCMVCHGIQFIAYNGDKDALAGRPILDKDGWALFVDYMHKEPAWHIKGNTPLFDASRLPPADRDTLVEYLGKNFGPDAPPRLVQKDDEPPLSEEALGKAQWVEYLIPNPAGGQRHSQQIDFLDGNLYISDQGRPKHTIVKLDPRTARHEDFPEPVGGSHGIVVDADGTIFHSGGGAAFAHFDLKTGLSDGYKVEGETKIRSVTEILDSKGDLWVGFLATAKLGRWDRKTETITYYETPNGRSRPYGLIVDHQDKVWYSSYHDSSLVKFDPQTEKFTRFQVTDKLTSMRRLGADSKDHIWSATYGEEGGKGGSVVHLDPTTGKVEMFKIPIKYSNPYDTEVDPLDKVWSTTDNYLVNFDPNTKKFLLYPYPVRSDSPKMSITRTGAIWFGLRKGGTNGRYGGGAVVLFPDKDKITELGAYYADNSVWGRGQRYKGPFTKVTGVMKCSPAGAKNVPGAAPGNSAVVGKLCEGASAKPTGMGSAGGAPTASAD